MSDSWKWKHFANNVQFLQYLLHILKQAGHGEILAFLVKSNLKFFASFGEKKSYGDLFSIDLGANSSSFPAQFGIERSNFFLSRICPSTVFRMS